MLWIHGPGGVGKTTLLSALAEAADARGRAPVRLDLRAVEPSPPAFAAELERVAGGALGAWERPGDPARHLRGRVRARGLAARDVRARSCPAGALVVVAGRSSARREWRRDAGWRDLLRVLALRNLAPDEARVLLSRAGVPAPAGERLAAITHGHPLALSLLLDVRSQGEAPQALDAVPDVVSALVTGFMAGVPSPRHRRALEIVAHARVTTGALLRRILGGPRATLLDWLRGLSFIESGPDGLIPHDLARDVVDADLRWRDRAAYDEVHRAVRADVVDRLNAAEGRDQQRALADLMYLHRGNPAAAALWDWDSLGRAYADAARPGDDDAVAAIVERHEGPESAALARHWLRRRPGDFAVVRGRDPEPLGVIALIALQDASEDDRAADPLARAAWEHAHAHVPPRPGDEVLLGRFFVDRDAHQAPSATLNLTTMISTREWMRRPRLSWCYIGCADADAFAPMMAYIGFTRAEEADAEVGGRRIAVFARDWRREGAVAWLERMGERELGGEAPAPPPAEPPALALSRPAFAEAVRDALRDLHRPAALAGNPLARTRVVAAAEDRATRRPPCARCSRTRCPPPRPTRATRGSRERSTEPTSARRRRRRPRRSCSGCRSAPTAAT